MLLFVANKKTPDLCAEFVKSENFKRNKSTITKLLKRGSLNEGVITVAHKGFKDLIFRENQVILDFCGVKNSF